MLYITTFDIGYKILLTKDDRRSIRVMLMLKTNCHLNEACSRNDISVKQAVVSLQTLIL